MKDFVLTAPALSMARGLRVLVADNGGVGRAIIAKMLERTGFQAIFANDGEQALDTLIDGEFDVALVDVLLPVMSGIELAGLYNFAAVGGRRTPLIALMADATAEMQTRCSEAGMQACLLKPFKLTELLAAVRTVVPDQFDDLTTQCTSSRLRPVLDVQTLAELKELGGFAFLDQMIHAFMHDGPVVLAKLDAAWQSSDVHRSRSEAYFLGNIAADLGAQFLQDSCGEWRLISETDFRQNGAGMLVQLLDAWQQTCSELSSHLSHNARLPPPRDRA